MGDIISAFFSTPILFRALVVGILVSLCAALLGVSLVLKRYSMIGDGLSHVGFGALAIAAVMNWAPMAVAVPVVIAAAFLLLRISGSSKIKGDSAIALISTGALAIGVMAVSLSGMNSDLDSYLFGSIYAISDEDVVISVVLALLVLLYEDLCDNLRRELRPRDWNKGGSVQHADRAADCDNNCSRNAHDGLDADFKPDNIPGAVQHEGVQELQGGHGVLGGHLSGDVHCGHGDLIRVRNSRRCEHRLREYPGVCGIHGGWRGHEP